MCSKHFHLVILLMALNLEISATSQKQPFFTITLGREYPRYFLHKQEGMYDVTLYSSGANSFYFIELNRLVSSRIGVNCGLHLLKRDFTVFYPATDIRIKTPYLSTILSIPLGINYRLYSYKDYFDVRLQPNICLTTLLQDSKTEYRDSVNNQTIKEGTNSERSTFFSWSLGLILEPKVYKNLHLSLQTNYIRQFSPHKSSTLNSTNRFTLGIGICYKIYK